MVFLSSSYRETAKNTTKKTKGDNGRGEAFFPSAFLGKNLDMLFPRIILMVF
jgi:hypothetical protein